MTQAGVTIPFIRVKDTSAEKYWNIRKLAFQQAIVTLLNEKSYLVTSQVEAQVESTAPPQVAANSLKGKNINGLLVLEVRDQVFRVSLRGPAGQPLAQWAYPTSAPLNKLEEVKLVKTITDAIVESFPYQGVVTKSGSGGVLINLGKKHSIQPGTILNVYEYEGDSPSFNSPKNYLGKIEVTKVSENAAVARPSGKTQNLHNFAKVETIVASGASQESGAATRDSFFIGAGARYMLLDSQTPNDASSKQRRFRINLSQFYHLQTGYGPVSLGFDYGNVTSDGNLVTFMSGQLDWELFETALSESGDFTFQFSLGANYTDYKVTLPRAPVVASFTSYSPVADLSLLYRLTGNTRFFGGVQIYYPGFSSDAVNGASTPASSYGAGFDGGLRVYASPSVAFEGNVGSKYMNWVADGKALQEIQFGTTFQGFYFF